MEFEIGEFIIRTRRPEVHSSLIHTIKRLFPAHKIRIIDPRARRHASLFDSPGAQPARPAGKKRGKAARTAA